MSDEQFTFGRRAVEQMSEVFHDLRQREHNASPYRARYVDFSDTPVPCANVYKIVTGIGGITGSFTWALKLLEDDSTVSTGTFTIGTSTRTTIKTQIDTDIGDGFNLIISGALPGEILLNPNRGRTSTKYDFIVSSTSLTEAAEGWPAFVEVAICCIAGG